MSTPGLVRDAQRSLPGSPIQLASDWVYERHYDDVPDNFGSIPFDVLDTLFILRLFRPGEISFVRHTVQDEDGTIAQQWPQRTMTEMYAPYSRYYVLHAQDCRAFDSFSSDVCGAQAWRSAWFNTARRFFLYGSAKELEVDFGVVDRIVDYMIALEAALVPEQDFVGRRLRERAVALIQETAEAKSILSKLYEVRSTIVHGSTLSKKHSQILKDHLGTFELWVRKLLVQAVKTLCVQETEKTAQLKRIYDISDSDRVERLRQSVHEIQNESLKAALVSCLAASQ
ncbi:MAG: hypothetical protein LAO76_23070 [Acidobacteriia bacterium]|nr:hypothetical protein [Terriglobia bacterium]